MKQMKKKRNNNFISILVISYTISIILMQIVIEKKINKKIREYDAREKE